MLDATELTALVDRVAYPLMVEEYETAAPVYPLLCDVMDISGRPDLWYGDKGQVMEGVDAYRAREDGQEVEHDKPGAGYTWYLQVQQEAIRHDIPERLMRALEANGRIADYVGDQTRGWGTESEVRKDAFLAKILEDGTLTAGNRIYFDGSFPGNADPNPTVIYDGLPFFDTAHTITGVSGTTFSNHNPTLALTSTNLQSASVIMRSTNAFTERNRARYGSIRPDTLIVPPQNERTAYQILTSNLEPGVATNENNIHAVKGWQLVVFDHLTADTDSWYLAQRGKGLKMYDGGMPEVRTSYDEKRKLFVLTFEIRFGFAVTNWRYWYAANKLAA